MNLDEFVEAVSKGQEKTVNKEVDDWPKWYRDLVIKKLKNEIIGDDIFVYRLIIIMLLAVMAIMIFC